MTEPFDDTKKLELVLAQRDEALAQLASARKALEAERDYWAEEVSDCAADMQHGAPFTDAVKSRIAYCAERADRINRALTK